jgi:hypothetical protein
MKVSLKCKIIKNSDVIYVSGLQPGVPEDISGGTRKHLTGYVKLGKNILFHDKQ